MRTDPPPWDIRKQNARDMTIGEICSYCDALSAQEELAFLRSLSARTIVAMDNYRTQA
jgi:hypothetical protein